MDIKKMLKKEIEDKYPDIPMKVMMNRNDIVNFTLHNESELGFSIEETTGLANIDYYMSAQTGGDIIIDGRVKYIGIIFDYEAFPDRKLWFTIDEIAERLEELKKIAAKINKKIKTLT